MPTLTQLGAAAGAMLAVLALIGLVWRSVRRAWKPVRDFLEDWRGEPARPGVPGRPGVMQRFDSLERRVSQMELQLHPNGGASLHDQVTRIADVVTGADSSSG